MAEQLLTANAFYLPVTTRLLTILRDGFGGRFKQYYEGDPIQVPLSAMPCLIVEKIDGDTQQDATGLDQQTSRVMVKIVMDKKIDFLSAKNKKSTHQELLHLMEGRDESTAQYIDESVLGIIRTQFTFNSTVVDQTININYGTGFRPNDVTTAEGQATFTITELIQVPVRT